MRIPYCCQCNSILAHFVNSPLPEDSSNNTTLRNLQLKNLKRKLVVFIKGNKEYCVTGKSL